MNTEEAMAIGAGADGQMLSAHFGMAPVATEAADPGRALSDYLNEQGAED